MENQTPINRIGLVPAQNRGHQIISVIRELFKPIIEVMEKESVYSISFGEPNSRSVVRVIRDSTGVRQLLALDTGHNEDSSVSVDADSTGSDSVQLDLPLPDFLPSGFWTLPSPTINWEAVQLHTQEVKHFFIPDHQSTGMMCEVCGRSELDSIHVTRKEYQR